MGRSSRSPWEAEALRLRHAARVLDVAPCEPTVPLAEAVRPDGAEFRAAIVRIEFPLENIGASLAALMTTVAGNSFELRELAGAQLLDVELSDGFGARYPGPRFGVAGTRELMVGPERPLIGSIIKPSVGLPLDQLERLVRDLCAAGVDFIKNDELTTDPPYSPLADRIRTVRRILDDVAERSGHRVMYAIKITGDIEWVLRHGDVVRAAGGTCVMACVATVGLAGIAHLAERVGLGIHGHRAMFGAMTRHRGLGVDFRAYQVFARLAGVNHPHTDGFGSKFYERYDEVDASIAALRAPLMGMRPVLPVLSSAQWSGSVPTTWARTRTTDLLMVAWG